MNAASTIRLKFGMETSSVIRARISYAFRVFAAIYNYKVSDADADPTAICVTYGGPSGGSLDRDSLYIPARYNPGIAETTSRQFTARRYADEDFYLLHGFDEATGKPDWLGELFEWISSSYEMGIKKRDRVGRIPDSEMIFNRLGISSRKPYATLLMAWLENSLRNGDSAELLPRAPSPVRGVEHLVVSSQDIDFYYCDRGSTFIRLLKNMVIAGQVYRDWSFFASNCAMLLRLLQGRRPGDYFVPLTNAFSAKGFTSTIFVVPIHGHRRDPNYRIEQIASSLREAQRDGLSVAVHGSYNSVIENGALTREARILEDILNKKPLGSRQHWLRFDLHAKLFRAVEEAKFAYDSSLGFTDGTGFRNGASFAFPPYNFEEEKPHDFLEIPLVLMDGALAEESLATGQNPQAIADEVLRESRNWSWGGVSVLWHNPMETIQVPEKINKVYWESAEKRNDFAERWMTADEFLSCSLHRYQDAGLLTELRIDA